MNNWTRHSACAVFVLVLAAQTLCGAEKVTHIDQGWTPEERSTFYHLEQGSHLMPYSWLLALESPFQQRPFLNPDELSRLRLLPDEVSESNPDGLPVGFAKVTETGGSPWAGLSCSACHTTQVQYKGQTVRADGGQGLIEFASIVNSVVTALQHTWQNDERFDRFARKVLSDSYSTTSASLLREDVRSRTQYLRDLGARSHPANPAGWGRMDAYNVLFNEFLGTALNEPRNYRVPFAPSSIPTIWLVPQLDFCTGNASIHDLMARDAAEISGVFGVVNVKGSKPAEFEYESSGSAKAFYRIEEMLQKLKPPAWPEHVLGQINQEMATRGAVIYQREKCDTCHWEKPPYPMTEPNKFGKRFIKVARIMVDEIGTDPLMTNNFVQRTARTGKFKPLMQNQEVVPAWQLFVEVLGGVVKGKLEAVVTTPAELEKYTYGRLPKLPPADRLTAYIAEPLAGIWASPPYLHNGSVPSLYHLLLPADKRPKHFFVGSRDYDPQHVGYVSKEKLDNFDFDVSVPGNSNAGHEYGTAITEAERMDLLEYLKTF